jgi:hypothetical protein
MRQALHHLHIHPNTRRLVDITPQVREIVLHVIGASARFPMN